MKKEMRSFCPGMVLVLAISCVVLSGTSASAEVFWEDFDGGVFPPAGWSVADDAGGEVIWQPNTAVGENNFTGGTGIAAMADSLGAGLTAYDTSLVTPPISFPTGPGLELRFLTDLETISGDEFADVDISTNGGATWTNLLRFNDVVSLVGQVTHSLDVFSGQKSRLRFRYRNDDPLAQDLFWQVDNVQVIPEPAAMSVLALGAVGFLTRRRPL